MKVIVFDKDGVLIDSAKEIFHEAATACGTVKENPSNFKKFMALYPCAKKAEDIHTIMKLLEDGNGAIKSLPAYEKRQAARFKKKFYDARYRLISTDYRKWLSMMKPFRFAISAFNVLADTEDMFISTTSDIKSALVQVKIFGIHVNKRRLMTKEISSDKKKHLMIICKRLSSKTSDILFIDNNIEQLKEAKRIGCQVALVSWGSNNHQISEAKKIGIKVLQKKNLFEQIKEMTK